MTYSRRLLSREKAAEYCGTSKQTFSAWVRLGRLPAPLPGAGRWDLKAIDHALDLLSGLHQMEESALDERRVKRARRSEGNLEGQEAPRQRRDAIALLCVAWWKRSW